MRVGGFGRAFFSALLALVFTGTAVAAQESTPDCDDAQAAPLVPKDLARCAELEPLIRRPGALPLAEYETLLGEFLRGFCHRNRAAGWKPDKAVRDTGPFIATLDQGTWEGAYHGTHAPVVIWYSREMLGWMAANRPPEESAAPISPPPVPEGSVLVKEMFSAPAGSCVGVEVTRLLPSSGAAVMVRDRQASFDGWFWGWFGWSGWAPDYPPGPRNSYPNMGFGQYCTNCHASAQDNHTFASLRNVEGEPGQPLVFLSQNFFDIEAQPVHHRLVSLPTDDAPRLGQPRYGLDSAFVSTFPAARFPRATWESVSRMPSETFDNVWVKAGTPTAASQFVTSDQCLGCHDAGSTGLQFDMTEPDPHGTLLLNLSPYATWRTSPMGLGGRDPIFYGQLASETESFHPTKSSLVQDVCLGCHGVLGQRQFGIDHFDPKTGDCEPFLRRYANATPFPADHPDRALANYGALARDGISCLSCHHMRVGEGGGPDLAEPWNRCVEQRQQLLNPENKGFARTFTGSFVVGPPGEAYGPFEEPKIKPMEGALGIKPVHSAAIQSSELCGSCHTVHLPVLYRGETIGSTYEQTTYPEWAFSAYRTGATPQGKLPSGPGARAESCQSCHMPDKSPAGKPFQSRIASIQEFSNFPQAEYNLGPEDIDLAVRDNFSRHTLVGLNVFFVKMAQQFPDVLGIRTQDPMMVKKGLDPLLLTEQAMLDQASFRTAKVEVGAISRAGGRLRVPVTVTSQVGHKFPSGVGFRRAFLSFEVLDSLGNVLWASGRSNAAGLLVDAGGSPLPGELWWKSDCSARLDNGRPGYQPHHQRIERQDQVQVYQELVTAPAGPQLPDGPRPICGHEMPADGPYTTSFLSICGHLKDNRILPDGFLPIAEREAIANALGAGHDMAVDSGPKGVGDDPDYVHGGGDALTYEVPLAELASPPAAVRARLFYQATPPYFLQDRFCTSKSEDTERLFFLAGHLNLDGTAAQGWKLEVVGSGMVAVPGAVAAGSP